MFVSLGVVGEGFGVDLEVGISLGFVVGGFGIYLEVGRSLGFVVGVKGFLLFLNLTELDVIVFFLGNL